MELKSPTPLGEKKIRENNQTAEFLEIVENKQKKKVKLPTFTLPSFNFFKQRKQETTEVHSNNITEKEDIKNQIKPKKDTSSFKTIFYTIVVPYIKEHKEKIINISLIVVPLFFLIILFLSILAYTRAEPYRISKQFLEKIEIRDTRGAYILTTDAYQAVVSEKEFRKIASTLNSVDVSNAKIKEKRIDDKGDMGQYAYVKYKISGYYLDLVLFNDARDWGILSIEISLLK